MIHKNVYIRTVFWKQTNCSFLLGIGFFAKYFVLLCLPKFNTLGNVLDRDHEVLDHPLIVQAVAGVDSFLQSSHNADCSRILFWFVKKRREKGGKATLSSLLFELPWAGPRQPRAPGESWNPGAGSYPHNPRQQTSPVPQHTLIAQQKGDHILLLNKIVSRDWNW